MTVPDRLHRAEESADHIDEYLVGKWSALGLAFREGDPPPPTHFAAWLRYMLAAAFGRSEPRVRGKR